MKNIKYENIIIILFFLISIFLAPLILLIVSHYYQMLPISALMSLINSRKGMVFSIFYEIVIIELLIKVIYCICNKKTIRKHITPLILSILIIISLTQSTNIISKLALLATSISVLGEYCIIYKYKININISLLRWVLLITSHSLAMLGFTITSILIIFHISIKFFKEKETLISQKEDYNEKIKIIDNN